MKIEMITMSVTAFKCHERAAFILLLTALFHVPAAEMGLADTSKWQALETFRHCSFMEGGNTSALSVFLRCLYSTLQKS